MQAISTKVFTGTIASNIFDWIDAYSKSQKRTKRDIMEKAIIDYQKKIKKDEMARGFKRMSKDKDMLEMAEWGIDDYLNLVK